MCIWIYELYISLCMCPLWTHAQIQQAPEKYLDGFLISLHKKYSHLSHIIEYIFALIYSNCYICLKKRNPKLDQMVQIYLNSVQQNTKSLFCKFYFLSHMPIMHFSFLPQHDIFYLHLALDPLQFPDTFQQNCYLARCPPACILIISFTKLRIYADLE